MRRRRPSNPAFTAAMDAARFGLDLWAVIGLRLARLGAGGPAAVLEAQRMVAEKVAAGLEAQAAVATTLMTGGSERTARRRAAAVYRRRVRANRRRLSGSA